MALQSAQLNAAITASQTTFLLTNLSANAQSSLPLVGGVPLSMGVPMLIDSEFMFVVSQPVLGTVVVRSRGSDGTSASAHDTLANVYFSFVAGDFSAPQAGTATTLDPSEDAPVSIGQDATLVLMGANTVYNINKATAAAITVPAPSLSDNGVTIVFTTNTAAAHVLTFPTGLIQDGTATPKTTATFTAAKGATVSFVVENGFFNVQGTPLGVTFS